MTKLTIPQVRDIKFGNAPVKVLEHRHNISASEIHYIRAGKRWGNIKPNVYNNPPKVDNNPSKVDKHVKS